MILSVLVFVDETVNDSPSSPMLLTNRGTHASQSDAKDRASNYWAKLDSPSAYFGNLDQLPEIESLYFSSLKFLNKWNLI